MSTFRGWVSDLALGVRLACGGGRTSLARLALSTLGIAVAVAVLLVGASVGTMVEESQKREMANMVDPEPTRGVDPVYVQQGSTVFRGATISAQYVYATGADHPVPHGMRALPGPDEVVVSPALADLLRSPEGELLRPRFPGRIAEVLDTSVVPAPGDLIAYVGADRALVDDPNAVPAYRFGLEGGTGGGIPSEYFLVPAELLVVVLVGAVVLLLPVFLFVASASRVAGAERDRRLSALRLVGSGSRQVHRIAAAESLVSALAGLVLGAAAFLVLRPFAEDLTLFGLRFYEHDVVPEPVLVVLVVLAIPALSVLTGLFALRRTIIEPLGVVREAKPVRRRLWWRLAPVVAGAALLVTVAGLPKSSDLWPVALAVGVALLLVGVPVLLPWLVERVAGRIHRGPTSWQLAIRRLQLDSGTSARVVGGVAVVLAGAVTLQTVLMSAEGDVGLGGAEVEPTVEVSATEEIIDDVVADLDRVPAMRDRRVVRNAEAYRPGADPEKDGGYFLTVMDCVSAERLVGIRGCVDGQVWALDGQAPAPKPGERLEFRRYKQSGTEVDPSRYTTIGSWTVPDELRHAPLPDDAGVYAELVVTPGALGPSRLPPGDTTVRAAVGDISSDDLERLRNAVAEYAPDVWVHSSGTDQDLTYSQQIYLSVRQGLYAGSIFTLLLAALSLLVLALEQIRERRRPLAVLAASGVPRGVLARSLLWQVALPIGLGVLIAVLTGVGLAWLIVRLSNDPLSVDWAGVGLLAAGAALLVLLVTAMTLPFLRGATRLTSLRTE